MNRATQNQLVLRLLREHGTVSARTLLLEHGIARAAARIHELREAGHVIETLPPHRLPDGRTSMAEYRLVEQPVQMAWTR